MMFSHFVRNRETVLSDVVSDAALEDMEIFDSQSGLCLLRARYVKGAVHIGVNEGTVTIVVHRTRAVTETMSNDLPSSVKGDAAKTETGCAKDSVDTTWEVMS